MTRARDLANIADGTFTATDLNLSGTLDVSGDATFDTNTLFVDVSANNVGVGTTSPSFTAGNKGIHIADATSPAIRLQDTNNANSDFTIYSPDGDNSLRIYHENNATDFVSITSGGNVGIGTTSPSVKLEVNGGTDNEPIKVVSTDAGSYIAFADNSTTGSTRLGAIADEFKIDVDGSEAMRIDDSGNVGIGTSSPSRNLDIQGTGDTLVSIVSPAANQAALFFGDTDSDSVGRVAYDNSDNSMRFSTAGSEAMRIDTSGNLLVGKTSAGFANTGHQLNGGGSYAAFTRDGATPVLVNRKTSDGAIVEYMKDGTTVGAIGAFGGSLFVSGSNSGVFFNGNGMEPTSGGNTRVDGTENIGAAAWRFKDLYLSGGVYLGGTGAANKLDDYEEGTFTPTLANGTVTYNVQKGWYTKIGRVVTVNILVSWTALSGSGNFTVSGLPFVPFNTDSDYRFTGSLGYTQGVDFGGREFLTFTGNGGTSVMNLYANEDNATPTVINVSNCSAIGEVQITTTYITNA